MKDLLHLYSILQVSCLNQTIRTTFHFWQTGTIILSQDCRGNGREKSRRYSMPGNELPAVNWQKFSGKRFAPAANIRQFTSRSADFPYPGAAKCGSRAQFVGVISRLISWHLSTERVRASRDSCYVRIAANDVVNSWLKSKFIHFREGGGNFGPFTGRERRPLPRRSTETYPQHETSPIIAL